MADDERFQIFLGDGVVPLEHGKGLVASRLHDRQVVDPLPSQVRRAGVAVVVKPEVLDASVVARLVVSPPDVTDQPPLAREDRTVLVDRVEQLLVDELLDLLRRDPGWGQLAEEVLKAIATRGGRGWRGATWLIQKSINCP